MEHLLHRLYGVDAPDYARDPSTYDVLSATTVRQTMNE